MELIPIIAYRDPLVGVIALFSIVLLSWSANSLFSSYKKKKKTQQLERFVENFSISSRDDEKEFEKLIVEYPNSAKMLFIVANGYFLSSEYEKSARFLSLILKHTAKSDKNTTAQIMLILARSFIKLGFLGRAKTVLIELLHLQPRDENALKELIGIDVRANDYSDSQGALEALEELNEKYSNYAKYFENMRQIKDGGEADIDIAKNPYFVRERAKKLVANNKESELISLASKDNNAKHLLDILWSTFPSTKALEEIKDSKLLLELFAAKGIIKVECFEQFEFELMSYVFDKNIADMLFSYQCSHCGKEEFDYFAICKKCVSLCSCEITPKLVKHSNIGFNMDSFS